MFSPVLLSKKYMDMSLRHLVWLWLRTHGKRRRGMMSSHRVQHSTSILRALFFCNNKNTGLMCNKYTLLAKKQF
jgi:hypothetical protein